MSENSQTSSIMENAADVDAITVMSNKKNVSSTTAGVDGIDNVEENEDNPFCCNLL